MEIFTKDIKYEKQETFCLHAVKYQKAVSKLLCLRLIDKVLV